MGGKASIIVIIGFMSVLSLYQLNLSKKINSAYDSFDQSYMKAIIHESALTAMNFGVNRLWQTETCPDSFNIYASGCTSKVNIVSLGLDSIKVLVKTRGYMFDEVHYAQTNQLLLVEDSLYSYFCFNTPASRFFWFTNTEGSVYWITGDTVWGPLHTNNYLNTSGYPVFYGKVTARRGISPSPTSSSNHAKYYGGWEVGINSSVPTNMTTLVNAAMAAHGSNPVNTMCYYNQNISLNFQSNGDVIRTVGSNPPDTVSISTIAPTGAIYCTQQVRVKGVFNGQLTIYSLGNLWIDDDIVYADNPQTNPNSDDLLGLVSNQNIIITDNTANNSSVVINATVMAVNGSFYAQNYSSRPVAGTLTMLGGIIQNTRGAVGTFSSYTGNIISGFSKRYYFDNRLRSMSPPYYPFVRYLKLVAWWE